MVYQTQRIAESQPPDLRIIPADRLLEHELHDIQRAQPLVDRIRREGILKNPPIVTPVEVGDDRFVLLDGANRTAALNLLKIENLLVQVVPYELPHVKLDTWYHAISGSTGSDLHTRYQRIHDLKVERFDIFHARALLAARTILAYYVLPNGSVHTLAGGGLDLHERTRLLRLIVDTYANCSQLNRVNTDSAQELTALYPGFDAVVVFPQYAPIEIINLARNGLMVPPGITRHIINGRAMRLNYPLRNLMAENTSLEALNEELSAWVKEKFKTRQVRYYAEALYLFDE